MITNLNNDIYEKKQIKEKQSEKLSKDLIDVFPNFRQRDKDLQG